jgi:hypothetical protein
MVANHKHDHTMNRTRITTPLTTVETQGHDYS